METLRAYGWCISFDDISFLVYEEFGEVPFYAPTPEPTLFGFQELVKWVSMTTIHIDLGK